VTNLFVILSFNADWHLSFLRKNSDAFKAPFLSLPNNMSHCCDVVYLQITAAGALFTLIGRENSSVAPYKVGKNYR